MKVLAAALLFAGTASASAAEGPRISGIYSDLRISQESGDLIGFEVIIIPENLDKNQYKVVFQCNQGWVAPVVMVSAQVKGSSISFSLPKPSQCEGFVRGRITRFGFEGNIDHRNAATPLKLKRTRSFWDKSK